MKAGLFARRAGAASRWSREKPFYLVLRPSQALGCFPQQVVKLFLFVSNSSHTGDSAEEGVGRLQKFSRAREVVERALYAFRCGTKFVDLLHHCGNGGGNLDGIFRSLADNAKSVFSDVVDIIVRMGVGPNAVVLFSKNLDGREQHQPEATRSIHGFSVMLSVAQTVLGCGDCYGKKNSDNTAYRLHPRRGVSSEIYVTSNGKQAEPCSEADRDQQDVKKHCHPVDSIPRFHVDFPVVHVGRIRNRVAVGEGC